MRSDAVETLEQQAARFWPKVQVTPGCWEWRAYRDKDGYGQFSERLTSGKQYQGRAHRWAWELYNGPVPPGLVVRHSCDNPPCCNPDHLLVGTDKDNAQDCVQRGRRGRTGNNRRKHSKLSAEQVAWIRGNCRKGHGSPTSTVRLAEMFGISHNQVSSIVNGKQWRDVA